MGCCESEDAPGNRINMVVAFCAAICGSVVEEDGATAIAPACGVSAGCGIGVLLSVFCTLSMFAFPGVGVCDHAYAPAVVRFEDDPFGGS